MQLTEEKMVDLVSCPLEKGSFISQMACCINAFVHLCSLNLTAVSLLTYLGVLQMGQH